MRPLVRFLFGGWGRRAAWVVLSVVLFLQALHPAIFDRPRWALFDLYEYTMPRLEHRDQVVIVTIDDASLKQIGQWPWPRQTMAELVTRILAAHPAALGLDIVQ